MKLNIPSYTQLEPYSCLPACIKVVLQFYGTDIPEQAIQRACSTTPGGTLPHQALAGIQELGWEATLISAGSINFLFRCISHGHPVIVFLEVSDLPYGETGAHAVVVCGFENGEIIYMDPSLGCEVTLDLGTFLHAWARMDNQGILIWG